MLTVGDAGGCEVDCDADADDEGPAVWSDLTAAVAMVGRRPVCGWRLRVESAGGSQLRVESAGGCRGGVDVIGRHLLKVLGGELHYPPCYPGPYLQDMIGTGYGVPIEGTDNCL